MSGMKILDLRQETSLGRVQPEGGFGDIGEGGLVEGISGIDLPATPPTDGQVLQYDAATGEFVWVDPSPTAADVSVVDAGGYFTGTDVEAILQELAAKDFGYLGHGAMGATETFSALIGWHSGTLDANCTFTLTDATSGLVASMVLELTGDGTHAEIYPGSVVWAGGSSPAVLGAGDVGIRLLQSRDGGSTWYGFEAGAGGAGVTYGTPALTLGIANAAGSIDESIRRDATIAVFDATAPTTSAVGDAAAAGSSGTVARRNHTHGRESFGSAAADVGTSSGGSATTPSRSNHVHATGAGTPSTQAFGDAAATGSGPAAAMTNHVHGMPANPVSVAGVRDVGGHWEVIMDPATSSPPVPVTTPDGTDWVYGWLSD